MTYKLSPIDILDLRASVRWHLTSSNGLLTPKPFIVYCSEEPMTMNSPGYAADAFAIYAEGRLWAISHRPEVLAACLRAEYAEPGFMRRVMNPAEDCETAILDPDARLAEQKRRSFEAKAMREWQEEQARAARGAPKPPAVKVDPTAFQLDLD